MDHKIKLEELNKEALEKLEAFMKERAETSEEDHDRLNTAKNEFGSSTGCPNAYRIANPNAGQRSSATLCRRG